MKWGIIVLLILGLVAAGSAAILVSALRQGASASADKNLPSGVEVMMARTSLPAMTVITLDDVIKEKVSKDNLPKGRLSTPARVIGRVLAIPVVEGQVLTESCFVTEGTGAQLAAALPHGMRAVTVTLSSNSIPDELLLYPGCVVDVLVSFRLTSTERDRGQAISTTMLRGIQVLAVAGDSVVSIPDDEAKSGTRARRTSRGATVTLMVDPKQAEALQLAADNGSIALAIRNPLDKNQVDMEATVLSQGRLASLGSVLTPAVFAAAQKERDSLAEKPSSTGDSQEKAKGDSANLAQQPKSGEESQNRRYPSWGITVIRGRETKVEELPIPEGKAATEADAKK